MGLSGSLNLIPQIKKMKALLFSACLLLAGHICFAQHETSIDYVSFYKTCDSLNSLNKLIELDQGIVQQLKQVDKKTPYNFFANALDFIEKNQFQEASIFYQIGVVRQTYYIEVNKNYAPNDDWMVAESMKTISGKKLLLYLQSDPNNYLHVLGLATDYCNKNDYLFSSKLNYPDNYQNAIKKIKDLQADISKNKEQFKKNWEAERAQLLAKKV